MTELSKMLPGYVSAIFDRMQVAEEEISKAQERHPERANDLQTAFMVLMPPVFLQGKSDQLYRVHCAELLDRVATGEDVRNPTRAELTAFLSDMSLEGPLTDAYSYAYMTLFKEVFPNGILDDMNDSMKKLQLSQPDIEERANEVIAELSEVLCKERP